MHLRPVDNPPNPWSSTDVEYLDGEVPNANLVVLEDHTREILSKNTSPDVGFTWSVNPYRGCFHACAYCYARPSHEYLSFGAGTDFDRKIVIKPHAAELLREAFERRSWKGELVAFSGVTDCYQPLEASYRLTRACLKVCAEYKNPVGVITKSALVERDVDLLVQLSRVTSCHVTVSIPFWSEASARAIEPFVTTPARRMRIVERLAARGLSVGVNVAPVIPGLNDAEIATILEHAKAAGASHVGMVLLRLPGAVKEVFETRVRAALPLRAERILRRVRETRGGKMNDSRWETRQTGEGHYANAISALFESTAKRLGLTAREPVVREDERPTFERPPKAGQMRLF